MNLYEMHVAAYKGEDSGATGDFYFTSLDKAEIYLKQEIEPQANLIELYSVKIDRIVPTDKLRLPELICNVANQSKWIINRSPVKEYEYDYQTGKREIKK